MPPGLFQRRPDLLPSIAIAFSSGLWGLFWIPVRAIEEAGVSVGWTNPAMFICVVLAFLPIAVWRWRNFLKTDAGFWVACGTAGLAFTFYAISFNLTDVVRAMLLFYMSPIWSTILGIIFLRERLTLNRVLAIILGLGGLSVILGAGQEFPWPRNIGDWFAIAAGLCWSIASVRFFQGGSVQLIEKVFCFVLFALVASILLAVIPLGFDSTVPELSLAGDIWVWLVVVTVFLVPSLYLTIWPATVLSPARVGILFMCEAIVGIGSAALLTHEPFGLREILGTLFIINAGIVEVIMPQRIKSGPVQKESHG